MRAERFRRIADHAADAALVSDVELQRNHPASEALDFRLERLQRIQRAAGDGEIGARSCERSRKCLSESAARAGDDGDFAGKVE